MHRNMDEILSSQRRMLVRGGIQDDKVTDGKLAELYENHLKKVNPGLSNSLT